MHYMATAEKPCTRTKYGLLSTVSSDGAKVGVRVHPPALLFVEQDIKKEFFSEWVYAFISFFHLSFNNLR